MPDSKKRRWRIGGGLLLTLAVAAGIIVWEVNSSGVTVSTTEGSAWHGNVGVRVASQVERITFREAPGDLPEALASVLYEVIHPAVDIIPENISVRGEVVFKVDATRVPLSAKDASGQPQRSIYNAGIQVFSETLGAWVDLETIVEGDMLVATAPHFSAYRAVWLKMGEFTVNGLKVITTAAMHLTDMFWQTGLEFMRQLHRNMAGKFDESKFDCSKPSETYTVKTGSSPTTQQRLDACVVEGPSGKSTLVLKNGWAVVMQFTADTTTNVKPVTETDLSPLGLLRNKLLAGSNVVFAPGLDTASFQIGPKAPERFQVNAKMSWTHTIVELEVALIQAFFPSSRAANVVSDLLDDLTCAVTAGQKLLGTPGKDIPPMMAELARGCLVPLLVNTFGAGNEILATVAKTGIVVPQLIQLGTNSFFAALTAQDMTATTFSVQKRGSEFDWLRGAWTYDCAGLFSRLTLDEDDNGVIVDINYDAQDNEDQRIIEFHPEMDGDRTLLVIDTSEYSDVQPGDKWTVKPFTRGGYESLLIDDLSAGRIFFHEGYTGPSYC